MLETSNLTRKYTHTYLVSETIPFSIKPLLIFLMSAFFCKKSAFLAKIVPLPKAIVWKLCWRLVLVLFSVSVRYKVIIDEYLYFTDYASEIQLPDCSKLEVNWKNGNDVTILGHDVIVKSFWRCFVSLVKFSYWSKFYVNFITNSGVITIFFYKGLTRNPEIGNTPFEFCLISGDWSMLRIANLTQTSLIKIKWNLQITRVTAFTVSELLREN